MFYIENIVDVFTFSFSVVKENHRPNFFLILFSLVDYYFFLNKMLF